MKIEPSKRIAALRVRLAAFDFLCSGTLLRRRLICGKDPCCCKAKPPSLHGPYYYWSHRQDGRLLQRVLPAAQAKWMQRAIRNHRRTLRLLRLWEKETVRMMERQKLP